MFHPHHPSWLVDADALPASPAVQRIIVLGDPDVRLVHPLLNNPLFARTVLVVPSSNPAKWMPVGEGSSSASLVILRTNKKHSKGGALHLLSVLQRAARTPLRPVKQYSQYDYEGREETFGFVPMSTMAEDTSEIESAGVLPVPSFHAVINFLDGRTGCERDALKTGILTTSLVGGFLLTGDGKGKTQLTAPRRTSRLLFLSRRPSLAPPTTTEEEPEHGAEESPSILDFSLAGALDGGGSKAWIRSMHDVRVTGGSVKTKGSGLPTPPDSEEDLDGVKGGHQLSDSLPSYIEEEREKTLRALEKGKEREREGSALGENPIRYSQPLSGGGSIRVSKSDGTGQNARRSTSRNCRSERSKPDDYSQSRSKSDHGHRPTRAKAPTAPQRAQTVSSKHTSRFTKHLRSPTTINPIPKPTAPSIHRSPTVARPHPVHHTLAHVRTPSDTHVSHVLPSLPTPRNTPSITMKNAATWDTRGKPLPRILRRKEGKIDARQRASCVNNLPVKLYGRKTTLYEYIATSIHGHGYHLARIRSLSPSFFDKQNYVIRKQAALTFWMTLYQLEVLEGRGRDQDISSLRAGFSCAVATDGLALLGFYLTQNFSLTLAIEWRFDADSVVLAVFPQWSRSPIERGYTH
ncbi:hypothetical protein DFS33DRAFT_1270359 [Desarmillaria ectypa]|nr:hypothetical protein DFS33DRAFT_1270359 [Desarmillaria ectypa]